MTKKSICCLTLFLLIFSLFGQSNTIKFLKGNITDKTTAVREASGAEAIFLSNRAIDFSLENKDLLGNDRELEGLVVAAIYSISTDYVKNATEAQKKDISTQFIKLFSTFNTSSTVEIALLTKIAVLKDYLLTNEITASLNNYLMNIQTIDSSVFKAVLTTFESIGNSDTFLILFNYLYNPKFADYSKEIEKTLSTLITYSMNETFGIVQTSDTKQLMEIFKLASKNSRISKNNLCEISEKVLARSILLMDDFSSITEENIEVQLSALKILEENKWSRASSTVISYFQVAKLQYKVGVLKVKDFTTVINSLSSIAPIDSVPLLTAYLEELNAQTEKGNKPTDDLILSVIKTLGAIGDKSAFDSLLAVTYLTYSETVLTAAREALSGLRWQ